MKRVYVNEEWCLGCHLCEYYCAFAQTNETDIARALKDKVIKPGIRVEEHNGICFAVSCRHCEEPLCAKSCITGALTVVSGIVSVDTEKCIGCYTCILNCPYGAISPSEKGAILKCQLCSDNTHGSPACVKGCPNKAIVFEERSM